MAMFRCGKLKVMSQTEPNVNGIFNLWVQAKIFSKCQPHGSMANWIQFCTEFTFVSNPKDNYSHDHWPLDQSCLGKKNEWSVSIMYMNHDCWLAFLAHDYQQMEVANTTPTRLTKEIHAQFRPLQPTTTWPHPVGDHYYIPLKTNDSLINLNSQRCDFLEHASCNHISSGCINEQCICIM